MATWSTPDRQLYHPGGKRNPPCTTRAIAAEAGVNEVTVFRRFGSKTGVLRALGEHVDLRATLLSLARLEVAAAGVFLRGDGATTTVVSPRGERYEMVSGGIYRYNAQRLVAEGVGWGVSTLFAAVPALRAALPERSVAPMTAKGRR